MNHDHPRSPVLDRRQPDVIDGIGRGIFATYLAFLVCIAFPPLALLLYPVPVTIAAFIVWSHGHSTSFISPFPVILAAIQLPLLGGLKAWLNPSPQRRRQLLALKVAIIVLSTFATLHFCVVP